MLRRTLSIPENTPIAITIYGILIAVFFGIIAATQVLAVFGMYLPLLSIIFPITAIYFATRLYFTQNSIPFFESLTTPNLSLSETQSTVDKVFLWTGITLFVGLFFFPLAAWPYSYISETLTWDAGLYHFPKAIELFRTGSFWDLTIPYGQYPLGYESLLSWGLTLTGNEILFGLFHALIALFTYLTIWLIARRYTRLPGGLLAFLTTLLLFSGMIQFTGNPWGRFASVMHTIGKNDLFLAAALLAVILHAPIDKTSSPTSHPYALAMLSMIALSIKPNSLLIVGAVWMLVIFRAWQQNHSIPWKDLRNYFLIILPGVLWAFRNLFVMKKLFSEGVVGLSQQSIFNNLSNPQFNQNISIVTWMIIYLSFFALLAVFWKKGPSKPMAGFLILLIVGMLINPAVLVFNLVKGIAFIEWRFGLAWLAYLYVLLALMAAPLASWVYQNLFNKKFIAIATQVIIISIGIVLLSQHRQLLQVNSKNDIVLRDQFRESVGVNGYHSAYDYVQQNITNSVIRVENGLPFYTYGQNYANYPTKMQYPLGEENILPQLDPHYFLIFNQNGQIPEYVQTEEFLTKWELIYQDTQGNLFVRKDTP